HGLPDEYPPMADTTPAPDGKVFNQFLRTLAANLRAGDRSPETRRAWEARRAVLRQAMFAAMGPPFPQTQCPLDAKVLGTLKRDGYRIERVIYQTRPDVWVSANAYVPEKVQGKV